MLLPIIEVNNYVNEAEIPTETTILGKIGTGQDNITPLATELW
jgi:hypothetical protein